MGIVMKSQLEVPKQVNFGFSVAYVRYAKYYIYTCLCTFAITAAKYGIIIVYVLLCIVIALRCFADACDSIHSGNIYIYIYCITCFS